MLAEGVTMERSGEGKTVPERPAQIGQNYFAVVVSTGATVVSAGTVVVSGAGVTVSVVTVSLVSALSVFEPQEAAMATTKAATNNFTVFFIDFGLKFLFIQKEWAGNPIFKKFLPWVTLKSLMY
jgi:hypothetical protein